jgi:hypothetical protein
MRGLLADINLQGHTDYLRRFIDSLGLGEVLNELQLTFATFKPLSLAPDLDDRTLWKYCQQEGWVLFTDNRNDDGLHSLESAISDLWKPGDLPVLTLASKQRFEREREYAFQVATDVTEVLFGVYYREYLDQPRIYVPL